MNWVTRWPRRGDPEKRTPRDEKAALDSNPRARRVGIASRRLGRARRHRDVAHSRRRGRYRHAAPARVRRGVRGVATRTSSSTCESAAAATTTSENEMGLGRRRRAPAASSSASLRALARPRRSNRRPRRARAVARGVRGRVVRRFAFVRRRGGGTLRRGFLRGRADPLGVAERRVGSRRARANHDSDGASLRVRVRHHVQSHAAIAARGIASPGEPARVLSADPRQALTLELVPLDDAGEIAGACVGAVSLTAGDFDADARARKPKKRSWSSVRDPRRDTPPARTPSRDSR